MAKRCVAYCRVSTNHEKQKTSIESQKAYYEEKFKGDGYLPSPYGMLYKKDGTIEPLPSLYVDEGISGTCLGIRKAFEQMIEDAKMGKFDVIYVKSVSRFARNTVDGLQTIRDLKKIGVGVIFEDCNANTLEEDSEMKLTLLFSVAQEESSSKSKNVKWGIRQRQKMGKWVCNAPLGYDKVKDGLSINEGEAEIVRYIFKLFTEQDYSVYAIAQHLNTMLEKYPTKQGKYWSRQQISRILRNSDYIGLYRSHIKEKDGWMATDKQKKVPLKDQYVHEIPSLRILDDDTWDKAAQLLKAREAAYSTQCFKGKNTSGHLLSSILFCRECGVKYTRQKRVGGKRKDGTRAYLGYIWGCRNYTQYGSLRCKNKYGINENVAIEQVIAEVKRLQQDIKERDGGALKTNFKAYLRVMYELDHEAENIEAIKAQIRKAERKKSILLDDYSEGLMSKELYQKEVKSYNDEIEELEQRVKSNELYDETIKKEWTKYENYKKRILSLDPDNLTNGDLKQVFNKIYVGVIPTEGKHPDSKEGKPVKYLIFSYALMGYSVEEIVAMYYEKGYADESTKIQIGINREAI